jgi:hypothetical protein
MTRVQELELKRLTPKMWAVLEYVARMEPSVAPVAGMAIRSARILARRGFLSLNRHDRGHDASLTDAGREAVARRRRPA